MTAENLVCCVGLQKTGKTHHLDWLLSNVQARSDKRAIVFDVNMEWPIRRGLSPAVAGPAVRCAGAATAIKAIETHRTVLLSPSDPGDATPELAAEVAEGIRGKGVTMILPEMWQYLPPHGNEPVALRRIVRGSRHPTVNTALWGDCQHFYDVSSYFTSAGTLHLFGQTGGADLRRVRETISPELVPVLEEAQVRAERGEPGWHVTVGPGSGRRPPFTLRRS